MENLLDNMPEPLLNQIKDLGKGLEKYQQGSTIMLYDPNKDELAGMYNIESKMFTPNYQYFIILEYTGLGGKDEQTYIYNNIIIPNLNLPEGAIVNPNRNKDSRTSRFINSAFRLKKNEGTNIKLD